MVISLAFVRGRLPKVIAFLTGRFEQRDQTQKGISAQKCLRGDLCLASNRREHPNRNFESLAYGIDNGDRTIAFLRLPEDPQPIAVKRMKRIKNLNVCDVRTQGIVRDDGTIRTFTA
jgi:hypothetical protein